MFCLWNIGIFNRRNIILNFTWSYHSHHIVKLPLVWKIHLLLFFFVCLFAFFAIFVFCWWWWARKLVIKPLSSAFSAGWRFISILGKRGWDCQSLPDFERIKMKLLIKLNQIETLIDPANVYLMVNVRITRSAILKKINIESTAIRKVVMLITLHTHTLRETFPKLDFHFNDDFTTLRSDNSYVLINSHQCNVAKQ